MRNMRLWMVSITLGRRGHVRGTSARDRRPARAPARRRPGAAAVQRHADRRRLSGRQPAHGAPQPGRDRRHQPRHRPERAAGAHRGPAADAGAVGSGHGRGAAERASSPTNSKGPVLRVLTRDALTEGARGRGRPEEGDRAGRRTSRPMRMRLNYAAAGGREEAARGRPAVSRPKAPSISTSAPTC